MHLDINEKDTSSSIKAFGMKNFRQMIFLTIISWAGLLWAAFLLIDNTAWFFPGLSMIGLILAMNIVGFILWLRS